MKIRIISVGKMKESYWKQAQQEYCKMLSRFCTVEIVEVADEKTHFLQKTGSALKKK